MKTHHRHRHFIMISSILAASRMSLFRDSRPTAAFALAGHKSISTRFTHRDVFDAARIPSTETRGEERILAHENSDIGDQAIGDSGSKTWQNPRSRWARRKHRKKMEKRLLHDPAEENDNDNREKLLNWESFEFGNRSVVDDGHSAIHLGVEIHLSHFPSIHSPVCNQVQKWTSDSLPTTTTIHPEYLKKQSTPSPPIPSPTKLTYNPNPISIDSPLNVSLNPIPNSSPSLPTQSNEASTFSLPTYNRDVWNEFSRCCRNALDTPDFCSRTPAIPATCGRVCERWIPSGYSTSMSLWIPKSMRGRRRSIRSGG